MSGNDEATHTNNCVCDNLGRNTNFTTESNIKDSIQLSCYSLRHVLCADRVNSCLNVDVTRGLSDVLSSFYRKSQAESSNTRHWLANHVRSRTGMLNK